MEQPAPPAVTAVTSVTKFKLPRDVIALVPMCNVVLFPHVLMMCDTGIIGSAGFSRLGSEFKLV